MHSQSDTHPWMYNTHTHMHAHMHTHTCTCTHTHTRVCIYTHTHTQTHHHHTTKHMNTHTYMHTHTQTHTHTHAHTLTHTHAHTLTFTQTQTHIHKQKADCAHSLTTLHLMGRGMLAFSLLMNVLILVRCFSQNCCTPSLTGSPCNTTQLLYECQYFFQTLETNTPHSVCVCVRACMWI